MEWSQAGYRDSLVEKGVGNSGLERIHRMEPFWSVSLCLCSLVSHRFGQRPVASSSSSSFCTPSQPHRPKTPFPNYISRRKGMEITAALTSSS